MSGGERCHEGKQSRRAEGDWASLSGRAVNRAAPDHAHARAPVPHTRVHSCIHDTHGHTARKHTQAPPRPAALLCLGPGHNVPRGAEFSCATSPAPTPPRAPPPQAVGTRLRHDMWTQPQEALGVGRGHLWGVHTARLTTLVYTLRSLCDAQLYRIWIFGVPGAFISFM